MSATFEEAIDIILAIFKTAWDAGATNPTLVDYQNVKPANNVTLPPDTNLSWARVTIQHQDGRQSSLSGALGVKRFDRDGLLTVQIFVPAGEGLSEAHTLSKIVADAYEGVAGNNGIWFRNVRVNEIGPDGDWFQTNILIDFTYDEIK